MDLLGWLWMLINLAMILSLGYLVFLEIVKFLKRSDSKP